MSVQITLQLPQYKLPTIYAAAHVKKMQLGRQSWRHRGCSAQSRKGMDNIGLRTDFLPMA